MAQVVIAYGDASNTPLERGLLEPAGLTLDWVADLASPASGDALAHTEALLVTTNTVDVRVLDAMPACRIVSRVGTGLDAIDLSAATARGVWVAAVPDYSVDEVATHTIALLLARARRLPDQFATVHRGSWSALDAGPVARLTEQAHGVVGFGRIGQAVVRKAVGVGLRVRVHDPLADPVRVAALGATTCGFDELLSTSDFVSLHVPLTPATDRLIDTAALRRMKRGSFLINTARGGLVDEEALLSAVRSGQLSGAAVDVLRTEPPHPDHPFLREERIWVTPHAGWYSEQSSREVVSRACRAVLDVLIDDRPPADAVNNPVAGELTLAVEGGTDD